tara:strand:- start:210 stop:491 length:282 start_codon:yes stop_codon:yes gene_type:complete
MEMLKEMKKWQAEWEMEDPNFWDIFIHKFLERNYGDQVDLFFRAKKCVDHAACELDTYEVAPQWEDRLPPQIRVTIYADNYGNPLEAIHDIVQ